ncbi:MAG TPA: alpha/beta fold hydrolase [Anaeromyxobacteraceae bacterium]|nr:alpha/beta fold hydrolase [Anaeromyxobacteraceae bacterium]
MRSALVTALIAGIGGAACLPPSWGAAAILHPQRRHVTANPSLPHRDVAIDADGVVLRGWLFPARSPARAVAVVTLHGIADNRESAVWIAERLVPEGFDVLAYDSRAHGESSGDACTYGFHEKRDLSRALDQLDISRAILMGNSLGAAIALQSAAQDSRIIGVVAADTFSDLETIARARAPFFASETQIREALVLAGREGAFPVADASPLNAARRVRVPVLLLHGALDRETPRAHSERVFAALAGPRELRIVPGAAHGEALGKAWPDVEGWIARMGLASPREPGVVREGDGRPGSDGPRKTP